MYLLVGIILISLLCLYIGCIRVEHEPFIGMLMKKPRTHVNKLHRNARRTMQHIHSQYVRPAHISVKKYFM